MNQPVPTIVPFTKTTSEDQEKDPNVIPQQRPMVLKNAHWGIRQFTGYELFLADPKRKTKIAKSSGIYSIYFCYFESCLLKKKKKKKKK